MNAGRWRASVRGVLVAVALSLGVVGVSGMAAQAAACVSSPVTDPMSVVVTPDADVTSYDYLELAFAGSITDGHCAGDWFTIALPSQLSGQEGSSYPMLDPDTDELVATMLVQDGQLVVTLTDYVESHHGVSVAGFVDVRVDGSFEPGEVWELTWTVNGEVSTTPIEFGDCPDCEVPDPYASKYADYDGGVVTSYVKAPPATQAQQVFTFTDTVGPNQSIQCPDQVPATVTGRRWTTQNAWGDPVDRVNVPMTVTACSATSITATVTSSDPGEIFQFVVRATATGDGPWTDEGTVVTQGESDPVEAIAYRYGGGGIGIGVTPTPTPTVSVTPTPTPTPTPTTSVTPTPTQTLSVTSTPTLSASVTTAPSPGPGIGLLAQTGTELTSIAAWGAAILAAGFLLVVGPRASARRH